jgi:hypothetical protein
MRLTFSSSNFFAFLFLFAIAMPTFHSYIESAGSILVNGLLIVFIATFLMVAQGSVMAFGCKTRKYIALKYLIPLVLMFFLLPLSMTVGLMAGVNIIERDFYEFYRPALYSLVFIFSYLHFSSSNQSMIFQRLLLTIFIIVVIFGLNHFFRFFDPITELYTKYHNVRSGRVSSPFVNPYDYAFFMTFFVYYFLVKSLFDELFYLPLFSLALVMLLLPQSRSVVAGFLIGFFLLTPVLLTYFGFTLKTLRMNKKLIWFYSALLTIVLLLVVVMPYLIESLTYLAGQFIRLLERGEIGHSASTRLVQFTFVVDRALENPLAMLFGNGPAKDEMEYVESIYTYLFYRYGLFGVVLYFYLLFMSIVHCFKIVKTLGYKSKYYPLFLAILLWLVTIPLLSIGNNFTEQVRVSFFYYALLGFVAASYYRFVLMGYKD